MGRPALPQAGPMCDNPVTHNPSGKKSETETVGMDSELSVKRAAFLGAGKMGGILLKALLEKRLLNPDTTTATVQHEERARVLSRQFGISVGTDNATAVRGA